MGVLTLALAGDAISGCAPNASGELTDPDFVTFVDVCCDLTYREVFKPE